MPHADPEKQAEYMRERSRRRALAAGREWPAREPSVPWESRSTRKMNPCGCGCGGLAGWASKFIRGHYWAYLRAVAVQEGARRCARCETVRPLTEFSAPGKHCRGCEEAYREARRDVKKAADARWRAEHPGASTEAVRRWRERNPERNRQIGIASAAARKARIAEVFVERVDPAVVLAESGGICGICGEAVDPERFHVDHIVPLGLGGEHSYSNVQAAHPDCNMVKGCRLVV